MRKEQRWGGAIMFMIIELSRRGKTASRFSWSADRKECEDRTSVTREVKPWRRYVVASHRFHGSKYVSPLLVTGRSTSATPDSATRIRLVWRIARDLKLSFLSFFLSFFFFFCFPRSTCVTIITGVRDHPQCASYGTVSLKTRVHCFLIFSNGELRRARIEDDRLSSPKEKR